MAVDGRGNVYVQDAGSQTIRKIAPDGTVTTLAGSDGESGTFDATGSAARFAFGVGWSQGIAVDGSGNVYVTDWGKHAIRKSHDGQVTSIGCRMPGHTTVRPTGMAMDKSGNIFVSTSGNTIIKITPDGVVTTLAGTWNKPGSSDGAGGALFSGNARSLAVDGSGNIYVADTDNCTIRKITLVQKQVPISTEKRPPRRRPAQPPLQYDSTAQATPGTVIIDSKFQDNADGSVLNYLRPSSR